MPYIDRDRRRMLGLDGLSRNPGDLAYVICREALVVLGDNPTFKDYAAVLGSIEAAKLELYRRYVAPYEDYKRNENGDLIVDDEGGKLL